MRAFSRRWTRPDVLELIERNRDSAVRYEVVDGELLVTAGPRPLHQLTVVELIVRLREFLDATPGVGAVLTSPSDVELERGTLVMPDVFVVSGDELRSTRYETTWRTALLTIEVLSTSSQRGDRGKKRLLYQRRVAEYWIVNSDARTIECWVPGADLPEVVRDSLTWRPPGASAPLVLDVRALFARVHGDVR